MQTSATFPSEEHISRLVTTKRSHTYRSYSSHMYDRDAILKGYYPDSMDVSFKSHNLSPYYFLVGAILQSL
jgi:hypothetical protein